MQSEIVAEAARATLDIPAIMISTNEQAENRVIT